MAKLLISRRARADFKRIWRYVALDDEAAANRLLVKIGAKIERLRDFPHLGGARDDVRPGARSLVDGRYVVLYEYDAVTELVEIIAVVEGGRDFNQLF